MPRKAIGIDVVAVDDRDPAVVVVDQSTQLVGDRRPDLANVVQPVELAREALQHLEMRDRADAGVRDRRRVGTLVGRLVEEHDQILAPRLGGHHRGLGASDQFAWVGGIGRPLRGADRDCDLAGRPELELLQALGQPVRERNRILGAARAHDDPELLAAEPADEVRPAHGGVQLRCELAEHLVADAMAVDVVDLLEIVDVQHQQRHGVPVAARTGQLRAHVLVEIAMVVEPGQRIGLGLPLEPLPCLGIVERQRGRVAEPLGKLELLVVEAGVLAEPVDAEYSLDGVACDQRHGDQRLALVRRRARHDHHPRVEVGCIRQHRLPMLRGPARDADAEPDLVAHDLIGPAVSRQHGDELGLGLVGLEDAERVVGDQLGKRVRDPVEQRVEGLLGEDVVEDVREPAVRVDEVVPIGMAVYGRRDAARTWHGEGRRRRSIHAFHLWRTATLFDPPSGGSQVRCSLRRGARTVGRARFTVAPASVDGGTAHASDEAVLAP